MKIVLERDDYAFSTMACSMGKFRTLVARINGKPFCCTRTLESFREEFEPQYADYIDRVLVAMAEKAFTKIFEDACALVPEGVDLLPEESK